MSWIAYFLICAVAILWIFSTPQFKKLPENRRNLFYALAAVAAVADILFMLITSR